MNGTVCKIKKNRLAGLLLLLLALCLIPVGGGAEEENGVGFTLKKGGNYCFRTIGCAAHVPTVGACQYLQGGGTDGEYAYYAMIDNVSYAVIYKYDLADWHLAGVSAPLILGHANDITFFPEKNSLVIPYCTVDSMCFVDRDTLTLTESSKPPHNIVRLEYVPGEDVYVVGSGNTMVVYRHDYSDMKNRIRNIRCAGETSYSIQGLSCDGRYIYDVRWDFDRYEASLTDPSIVCDYVAVYDIEGEFFGDIPVYGMEGEPENIICLGGNRFAIGCNVSDNVYLVELIGNDPR